MFVRFKLILLHGLCCKMAAPEEPSEIKDIPLRVLSQETLKVLSVHLNPFSETIIPGCDRVGDYRGLAELYGKTSAYIIGLENKSNPTVELLKSLSGRDATLSKLWQCLLQLGRTDVLRKCQDLFKRDTSRWHHRKPRDAFEAEEIKNEKKRSKIKAFFDRPSKKSDSGRSAKCGSVTQSRSQTDVKPDTITSENGISRDQATGQRVGDMFRFEEYQPTGESRGQGELSMSGACNSAVVETRVEPILTIEDMGTERPTYDAYINCAGDDIRLAKEMLNTLEASPYNLRLFLSERQLMPGGSKYEDIAAVVEERCHGKVVIILTRNYISSEACQFVTNFARALDPASRNKQIIPIMYEHVEVPRMLKGMYIIYKLKDEKRGWFWPKLKDAIKQ